MARLSQERTGLALIETLVSIGIIGVLVAILVPGVASVRSSAIDASSLANLRTHTQMVSAYSVDHREYSPYFADPNATFRLSGRTAGRSYLSTSEVPKSGLTRLSMTITSSAWTRGAGSLHDPDRRCRSISTVRR